MNLGLELFWVTPTPRRQVAWARRVVDLGTGGTDPDDLVLGWLHAPPSDAPCVDPARCVVHSTSWRYSPPATLLVTYLIYGEDIAFAPIPDGRLRVAGPPALARGTRLRPRPAVVTERAVLLHGLRHLAFLLRQPGAAMPADWLSARSRSLFATIDSGLAGGLGPVGTGAPGAGGPTR